MDLGSGIPLGTAILGGIAVIFRLFPSKKSKNPDNSDKSIQYVAEPTCLARSQGLERLMGEGFTNLKEGLARIEDKIDGRDKLHSGGV